MRIRNSYTIVLWLLGLIMGCHIISVHASFIFYDLDNENFLNVGGPNFDDDEFINRLFERIISGDTIQFKRNYFDKFLNCLPYKIDEYGDLAYPQNLSNLLTKVDVDITHALCHNLDTAIVFLRYAAASCNIDCIVYVFFSTNLIEKLRNDYRLNEALKIIKKSCYEYWFNCISKNIIPSGSPVENLFQLTPFFSINEFLYETPYDEDYDHLLCVNNIHSLPFCSSTAVLKMLFVCLILDEYHVPQMFLNDCLHLYKNHFFALHKQDFMHLLCFVCKKNLFEVLLLFLRFAQKLCIDSSSTIFTSVAFDRQELSFITSYASHKIPQGIQDQLEKYLNGKPLTIVINR